MEVAVLRLPGLSNFTDFQHWHGHQAWRFATSASLASSMVPTSLFSPAPEPPCVPWNGLRWRFLGQPLLKLAAHPHGPFILGLCGGFQLLGRTISDPQGCESASPMPPPWVCSMSIFL